MREMVTVGERHLLGEIIRMEENNATLQVYEETQGLRIGEDIIGSGRPLSVSVGPGLIGGFSTVSDPLGALLEKQGCSLPWSDGPDDRP